MRLPIKIITILLTICFLTSNATLSWSGVCVNQEGTHSFSETSSLPSCHAQDLPGESHCFTLEKENVAPSTSGEECVDFFFSSEANLTRLNQKASAGGQQPFWQYDLIISVTPHTKKIVAHPDQAYIPDKLVQMQRTVVLLI